MPERIPEWNRINWVLECGCEPDLEHCNQCDERRRIKAEVEHQERLYSMANDLRAAGWTVTPPA